MLSQSEFERMARQFALQHRTAPTWAWFEPGPLSVSGAFAPPPGFLRSSPIVVQPPIAARRQGGEEEDPPVLEEPICSTADSSALDVSALDDQPQPDRLSIHICRSATYQTPQLLLLGCHGSDGRPWDVDEARAYLQRQANGSQPLPDQMLTPAEHPGLGLPCVALHACHTAELLSPMMRDAASCSREGGRPPLDLLGAWWSLVAPLLGLRAQPGPQHTVNT